MRRCGAAVGGQALTRLEANLALFAASKGNPADVIAAQPSQLRLQALAIRMHSAAAFLRAETAPGAALPAQL